MGTGNGNAAATSGQAPTAATALAAGPPPTALATPAGSVGLAIPAAQVPETISASKPVIQDKVSNAPGKVDKIGTAVEIYLIFSEFYKTSSALAQQFVSWIYGLTNLKKYTMK